MSSDANDNQCYQHNLIYGTTEDSWFGILPTATFIQIVTEMKAYDIA